MKTIFFTRSTICSLFLLLSCREQERIPNSKEILDDYLQRNHFTISKNALLLFVPSTQCKNCVSFDFKEFPDSIRRRIVVVSKLNAEKFQNEGQFLNDKKDDMAHLPFLSYQTKLVSYSGDTIEVAAYSEAKVYEMASR